MTTIASGVRANLRYIAETVQGTTPTTPTFAKLRSTGRRINLEKNTLQSQVVESHRQERDLRHGFHRVVGDPGYELAVETYDDFLEACLGGTWTAVTTSGSPDLATSSGTNTLTRATGSFITDGYRIGDLVTTASFGDSENNGTFRVTDMTATTLVFGEASLTTESSTSGPTVTGVGKHLDIGTTMRTFAVERAFEDINQFQLFNGVSVNTWNLNVQPEQLIGGTFGLLGMAAQPLAGTTASTGGTPTEPPNRSPLSAFDGALFEGGSTLGVVTGLDLTVDNKNRLEPVVGSLTSPCVFNGQASVTGNVTAFFQDATLLNKFINETESSLWLKLNDIGGSDFLNLVLPRIKYTGGDIDPPTDGPVSITMPIQALYDNTAGTALTLQRSNS